MRTLSSILIFILISTTVYSQNSIALKQSKDTLKIGYYVSPPFTEYTNGKPGGISFWLWQQIANELKHPYTLHQMTLKEVVEGLSNGSLDMTVNPLTITSTRSSIIDFSAPYFISNSGMLVKTVSSLKKGLAFILSFFSINFLRAVLALFIVILIFGTIVWFFERKANPEEFKPGLAGLWSGIWWSAVTMTTVGYGDKSPKSTGGRIVALVWMFAAIIIISGFTAGIASSLTVNQLGWDKSKLDDFKKQHIATVEGSATENFLKRRFFKNNLSFKSLEECTNALRNDKVVAVAYDIPQLTNIIMRDSTKNIELSPVQYNSQLYAFGFSEQLDESIKERITNELLKIVESTDYQVILGEYGLIED